MSLVTLALILAFLAPTEYNESHSAQSPDEEDPEGHIKYPDTDLKCLVCHGSLADTVCDRDRLMTCRYTVSLLNWDHVQYSELSRFACAFLRYKEGSGRARTMKGCVAVPDKDYDLCVRIRDIYKTARFIQCRVCYTNKCNIGRSAQSDLFEKTMALLLLATVAFAHQVL